MTILYTDGSCVGNSEKDYDSRTIAYAVSDSQGKILIEKKENGGSNNIAELKAIVEALLWAKKNKIGEVEIRTDSKIAINWIYAKKFGKHLNNKELVIGIRRLIDDVRGKIKVNFIWAPREINLAGHYFENVCASR